MVMKKNYFLFFAILVLVSSCKKFSDINTDPTKSANLDPALQLGFCQQKFSGDLAIQERLGVIFTMPLVQHIGGAWANQYGQFYVKQERYASLLWEDNYVNEIKNILDAENRSRNNTAQLNLNAMCRVMQVYLFARITDMYGDVPYKDASAAYSKGISAPVYDKQEDIYNDFFNQLDTATIQFATGTDQVTNDAFYKGNTGKWKKFTASLRLRLALRIAKVNPDKAKAQIQQAYNDGLMTSNDDICMLKHDGVQNDYGDYRGNGLSAAINQGELVYYRISNTLIRQLRNTNDPRLYVFAGNYLDKPFKPFERENITEQVKSQVGSFGVQPEDFIWDNWQNTIFINTTSGGTDVPVGNYEQLMQVSNPLIANNAPFLHLTYAEVELLLADASVRFGLTLGASAADHYKNGLHAACSQLSLYQGSTPITEDEISSFIQDNPLSPGRELEIINTQLWVAYFMNGPEAYSNLRRSGYPVLPSGFKSGYSESNSMPRRMEYPISEKALNAAHANEAISRMGGQDSWNKRIWWDKE
jgi:hypothetical protein